MCVCVVLRETMSEEREKVKEKTDWKTRPARFRFTLRDSRAQWYTPMGETEKKSNENK